MEYLNLPVIAAFVAALLGSFFAALFKEQFSDAFYKRKRIRDIRGSITKDIIILFNTLIQQTVITNVVQGGMVHKKIIRDILVELDNSPNESNRTPFVDELTQLTQIINTEVERENRLSEKATECYSNIYALIIEANHYIKKSKGNKLKSLVQELATERHSANMTVDMYKGNNIEESVAYRNDEIPKKVNLLKSRFEEKLKYYIDTIHKYL